MASPVITGKHSSKQVAAAQQKVPSHLRLTSAASVRHTSWTKQHYEWMFDGRWYDDSPGPGAYSPLAQRPTGGKHVRGSKQVSQSFDTLGSPCFSRAYKKSKDKWFSNNERRLRKVTANRLLPVNYDKKTYPVLLCQCVSMEEPPDHTRCEWCRLKTGGHALEQHRDVCPSRPIPCPHCHEEYKRKHLDAHVGECDSREIPCQYCHNGIKQGEMKHHMENCTRRPANCDFCKRHMMAGDLHNHMQSCEMRPELCQYCQKRFPHHAVEEHRQNCDMRPVKCRYCDTSLTFAEARNHRDRCPERPQECSICHQKVRKSQSEMHSQLCSMILQAGILLPKLKPVAGVVIDVTPGDDVPQQGGVLVVTQSKDGVANPRPGGPADVAGLKAGDHIYQIDNEVTLSNNQFKAALTQHSAGDKVDFHVNRGPQKLKLTVEIGGMFVNPTDPKDVVIYTPEDIKSIRRIGEGSLQESDRGSVKPFWVTHAQLYEQHGGDVRWTTTRRSTKAEKGFGGRPSSAHTASPHSRR